MKEKELKPCPFCGDKNVKLRKFKTDKYRILCSNCGATGSSFTQYSWESSSIQARNRAITGWNRRYDNGKL